MTSAVAAAPARTWLGRLTGALPLVTVFFWLCLVYAWQSWGHLTPWLFTDELELTQLSRAVAETGHAARRGDPHSFNTLFTFMLAPAWWISDTETAYATAKYIVIATMTSVVFPAYWLARLLVSPRPALFAAAGAGVVPAFLYSTMLVEEPLAYPYATLAFFLLIKALATRRRGWLLAALAACLGGPLVRGELVVLSAVFLLAGIFLAWTSARARRVRSTWSRWDWAGGLTLIGGAVILLNAFISHHSYSWLISTTFYKHRMIDNGLWAAGALAIGLGILPVVAGLAVLVRPRGELWTAGERAFAAVVAAAIIGFGWYTAVKAAYISTVFSTLVVERNLIYLAPLFLAGTALFVERRRLSPIAVVAASAFVLYLVLSTPYKMEFHLYSDAPGLAILQGANRVIGLTPSGARIGLLAMLGATIVVCLLPWVLRGRDVVVRPLLAACAVVVLAWNAAGEIAAASASNSFSNDLTVNYAKPVNWVDRVTGGASTMYLGQRISDPNGLWLLEFWNRSIDYVWSLDGTAPGPGPTVSPDLLRPEGYITQPERRPEYVVTDEGITMAGTPVATAEHKSGGTSKKWTLYRVRPPLRLRSAVTGIYDDGWAGHDSSYSRYTTPGGRAGYAAVTVSRAGWGGASPPSDVTIRVGPLVLDKHHQPDLNEATQVVSWTVASHLYKTFYVRTPRPPFRVEVTINPTFVPARLDPNSSETRELGAQVSFDFVEKLPQPRAKKK